MYIFCMYKIISLHIFFPQQYWHRLQKSSICHALLQTLISDSSCNLSPATSKHNVPQTDSGDEGEYQDMEEAVYKRECNDM